MRGAAGRRAFERWVARRFEHLLLRRTGNFIAAKWLGTPIWQNVLDLWTLQETLAEVRPALLVEVGTNRGGSALFFAHLFDLMDHGEVLTIDVEVRHELDHPRVEFLHGSSTDAAVMARVRERVREATAAGPVFVILDGDHSQAHVARELELYAPLVTPGSFLLSQDGIIDTQRAFRAFRPGPLAANRAFLAAHAEFEHDAARSERFLITHHPSGWMRRRSDA